jgi:hypothetical protein
MKADYQIKISQGDFERLNKIMKVVYNDLNNLLIKHETLNIVIKEDGNVHCNFQKTGFILTDQDRTIRFLLNLYHFISKNSHLFNETFYSKSLENQDWFIEYKKFYELVNFVQGNNSAPRKQKHGR